MENAYLQSIKLCVLDEWKQKSTREGNFKIHKYLEIYQLQIVWQRVNQKWKYRTAELESKLLFNISECKS